MLWNEKCLAFVSLKASVQKTFIVVFEFLWYCSLCHSDVADSAYDPFADSGVTDPAEKPSINELASLAAVKRLLVSRLSKSQPELFASLVSRLVPLKFHCFFFIYSMSLNVCLGASFTFLEPPLCRTVSGDGCLPPSSSRLPPTPVWGFRWVDCI